MQPGLTTAAATGGSTIVNQGRSNERQICRLTAGMRMSATHHARVKPSRRSPKIPRWLQREHYFSNCDILTTCYISTSIDLGWSFCPRLPFGSSFISVFGYRTFQPPHRFSSKWYRFTITQLPTWVLSIRSTTSPFYWRQPPSDFVSAAASKVREH
jgi:hypothetical protein